MGLGAGVSWTARNVTRGTVVASELSVAKGPLGRVLGLLGRPPLRAGQGLWLAPCRQVHSCGMRYPLDVAFVDHNGRVVRVMADFRPWHFSPWVREAAGVIELPAGALAASGTRAGDTLVFEHRSEWTAGGEARP